LKEHWQATNSPALSEEAQSNWKNEPKSWRKTSYDKKRAKRSANIKNETPYPEINVMLTTVAIGFICVGIVVIGGYIERKTREARNARHEYHASISGTVINRYEQTRKTMIEHYNLNLTDMKAYYTTLWEKIESMHVKGQEKMETLVAIYQDILKQHATNSPYPIRLTGGHFNEDFAIIAKIMHWNVQWRENGNVNLMPSSFIKCPHDLPSPETSFEWDRLIRKFYEESGLTLEKPSEDDDGYAEILDVTHLTKKQLCATPVCIKPDLNYEGKESKCHYCNNICCNCENCKKFRAFFQIRTALINTGKVNHWDYLDARMERQVHLTSKLVQNDRQMRKIMETLYERARIDNPQLPTSMDQLKGQELRSKLRKIAVRMMEGPMIKLITSDEKLNEMADELTNEVVEHFLKQQGIVKPRTTELMRWVTRNYHKTREEEQKDTEGGSGVTVRFDCNTNPEEQELKQDVLTNSESSEEDSMNTNSGEMLTMSDLD